MKQGLNVTLGQGLHLTPQLLQSIRLLQLPALELEQELREALERNVMLEREEGEEGEAPAAESAADAPADASTASEAPAPAASEPAAAAPEEFSEWEPASEVFGQGKPMEDEEGFEARRAAPEPRDVRLKILSQIQLTMSDPSDLRVAENLLDRISPAGYLEAPFEEVCAAIQAELPATAARVRAVLNHIQRLDPAGYGAADLRECLSIQLEVLGPNVPGRTLAMRLVDERLEAVGEGDLAALAAESGATTEAVARAVNLIRSLSPKPGDATGEDPDAYALPDVIVRRAGNAWRVELNPATAPRVRVNGLYEQLLHGCRSESSAKSLRDQLQEARWLVRGLHMRNDTLLRTMKVVIERQGAFLERGEEGLKPLTLREVADAIGMHESTVSRITTNKWAQTPRGLIELKRFFANSVAADREGASGAAVRAMVKRLIENEPAGRPLADGVIAKLLERQGVKIARRTVTKYREALRIASARERGRPAKGAARRTETVSC